MALRFRQGNGVSLQTAGMSFVMVSHDITTDGPSRGPWTESSLRCLSLSHAHAHIHTHRYDLTTTTFQVSPCCPHPHQKSLLLRHTLTPYLPPHRHTRLRLHCLPWESFSFQQGDELTTNCKITGLLAATLSLTLVSEMGFLFSTHSCLHAVTTGQRIMGKAIDV